MCELLVRNVSVPYPFRISAPSGGKQQTSGFRDLVFLPSSDTLCATFLEKCGGN